ncbi:hypothetical protein WS70_25235 [Burkholderia mayonis]|uniref:Uncharacterized protein n=1 Tax=Burkholderia mayonis TaxID=1385591 RepID=A0A1B4FMY5_9BURK|nr:hypothetical protein WS70_25235 [Burkholderia mayonis]KVE45734.1 hypothetical protein WS70_03850 [Burkholderia mayonis]
MRSTPPFSLGLPQSFPVTLPSAWSPVIPLPVNPTGIANTPNGKLVMWSADQQFGFQNGVGGKTTQTCGACRSVLRPGQPTIGRPPLHSSTIGQRGGNTSAAIPSACRIGCGKPRSSAMPAIRDP